MTIKARPAASPINVHDLSSDGAALLGRGVKVWLWAPMKTSFILMLITLLTVLGGCGEQTPQEKLAKLLKDAELGNAEAQAALGRMYLRGEGVPKDSAKAFEWNQKAVAQGNAQGQNAFGAMYELGEGVPKDAAKAREWYEKAATQGLAEAQVNLGRIFQRGEGVPKDSAKAVEYYQKAAAQGHPAAQNNLGTMYADGHGVPKDPVKAAEWYQRAATQGEAAAQYNLAQAYAVGEGVPKDPTKAFEWCQKAAAQGHRGGQGRLSMMYLLGEGVAKDKVLGYAWANLSAARGSEPSKLIRDIFEHGLTLAERAEGQRLASNWKPGTILARESLPAIGGRSKAGKGTAGAPMQGGTGTGFVVSGSGHILTSLRVVDGCTKLRISGRKGVAKLLVTDRVNDLAVLQIPGETKDFARLIPDPSKLRQGEDIVVHGYPLNAVRSSGGNLSPGVVSAMPGLGNNTNRIQITAPIQPGFSGSPVIDKKGHVVGMVSMKLLELKTAIATGSLPQNVNFAVNAQTLRSFLDAHKVPYKTGSRFFVSEKSTADLAEEAQKWTVIVECLK
jgi:TPR repeat protein